MRRSPPAIALAALLSTACAGVLVRAGVLQRDRIRIPHTAHRRAEIDCLQCHEAVYDATSLDDRLLPKEAICLQCHQVEREQGRCVFCHTEPTRPAAYLERTSHLLFSHAAHLERMEENCGRCHIALPDPLAGSTPSMDACLSCHEHRAEFDAGLCARCHEDLTRYALVPVSRFSHTVDFERTHKTAAPSGGEACATCHEQTFCSDCHASTAPLKVETRLPDRPDRGFIHRHDFIARHAIEAQVEGQLCRRCHGSSFCDGCHTARGLTPETAAGRTPHPPGWVFPGSPESHADAARRDIASCAACHDQPGSICIDCHRIGGIGGNPHPDSFLRHRDSEEITKNGMCLICHL